ncbi:MAG TPA: hypothetical protein VKU85_11750 [bacterium]|nr:hypothetical protein [bacterium]
MTTKLRSASLVTRTLGGLLALALVAAAPGTSNAMGLEEYGPRVGFSIDPDQFTIGAFADWGELGKQTHLVTSGDLGFGDNIFSVLINGDVFYRFNTDKDFYPYAGGGIAIGYYDFDINYPAGYNGPRVDSSTTEVGLSLVGGVTKDLGGYKSGTLELRLGISDVPDVKITAQLGFF